MNVGGSSQDVKASSLSMPVVSVGGVIVLGESRPPSEHGKAVYRGKDARRSTFLK
jgi:hypothetical protein